jgi:hypothetical protein
MKTYRIKEITTIKDGKKYLSYRIQRKYWAIFWETGSNKDVLFDDKKGCSFPNHMVTYSSIEKARNGVELWKRKSARTIIGNKILKPVSC